MNLMFSQVLEMALGNVSSFIAEETITDVL